MIIVIILGILGSFFAAMKHSHQRFIGFCLFTITNVCWVVYGFYQIDYNIILQFGCFLFISLMGLWSNKDWLTGAEAGA